VLNSIKLHEAACRLDQLPPALGQSAEIVSAKLIYYALEDLVFSNEMARWAVERNLANARPAVADIPAAGTAIRRGQPVVTLFADGLTSQSTLTELERAAQELENLLDKPSHPL
jgi:predicted ATP-grasp superfamily ATP-dependent carboligase